MTKPALPRFEHLAEKDPVSVLELARDLVGVGIGGEHHRTRAPVLAEVGALLTREREPMRSDLFVQDGVIHDVHGLPDVRMVA